VSLREKVVGFLRDNMKLSMLMKESLHVFSRFTEEPYRNFMMGHLHDRLMRYCEITRSLLGFLEEYISLCFTAKRFFLDLLYAIRLERVYRNVLQEDGFLSGAKVNAVDASFLRLHVKLTINVLAPSIDMTLKGFPLDELEGEAEEVESKFILELISKIRVQADYWDRCVDHLNILLEKIDFGGIEEVVEKVKDLLGALRPFLRIGEEALSQITSKLGVEEEGEILVLMKDLSEITKEFLEKWRESHEATMNYLRFVLFMAWGNVNYGLEKWGEVIQGKNIEELVPDYLSPKDVFFAASRAMIELNEATDASRIQIERLQHFSRIAGMLESSVLTALAEEMKKRFEMFKEFQQNIFKKLEEIRVVAEKQVQQ